MRTLSCRTALRGSALALLAASWAGCSSTSPADDLLDPSVSLYALVTTIDGVTFSPPLGPEPGAPTGSFDPTLLGRLRVVLETTDAQGQVGALATFDPRSTPPLMLLGAHDLYFVNVPATTYFTNPALAYRFRVLLDEVEIGRSDMSSKIFEVMSWVPSVRVGVKLRIESRPAPAIAALTPAAVEVGSADFVLTVDGASFTNDSVVSFGGQALATTKVSSSRLTATVPAAQVAATGQPAVTVVVPAPGGGTAAASFEIYNPAPSLASITPASVAQGASSFTMTLAGSGFASGAFASLNGAALTTTFVSSGVLLATVTADRLTTGGAFDVVVTNPAPRGGTSAAETLTITRPRPTLSGLTPASVLVGAASTTLTIDGAGFVAGAQATFDGAALATTFVSSARLTAVVPSASLATAGSHAVVVTNLTPSAGPSAALTFLVTNPTPSLTTTTPSSVTAGAASFTLTINGASFVSGATASFDGAALATTFVSSTRLTATVPATAVAAAGTFNVTASNPAPGGGAGAPLTFTVNNAAPAFTTLSPSSANAGSAQLTITLTGSGFTRGSYATFHGAALTTTYGSDTQLTAVIPTASLATAGNYNVTVVTPAPGGGTSAARTFQVVAAQVGLALHLDAGNATSAPAGSATWYDLSGNGRNATLTNGATFDATRGGSVYFDGVNDQVVVPGGYTNILRSATAWTFSVWLSVRQFSPPYPVIFSIGPSPASNYYEFFLETSAGQCWMANGGALQSSLLTTSANTVYNFVWVLSGTTGYLYRNGVAIATYPGMAVNSNVTGDLLIGAFKNAGYELAGNIYQVQVYNRALSGTEVTGLFNNLRSRFGL